MPSPGFIVGIPVFRDTALIKLPMLLSKAEALLAMNPLVAAIIVCNLDMPSFTFLFSIELL
ncbi:hypothetical protein F9U57_22075 [Escherichia coli]|nr:hypothetical protein [Escherichia coli]EFE7331067.1 hypothetical protein [Escherichia coli]